MKLLGYIICVLLAASCSAGGDKVSPEVEQALYHFYTGQSYMNEHKYYQAMEEFLQAEQLCGKTDKVVLKGQICWHKGSLYAEKMNYSNAIEMFSKAIEFYNLAKTDVREYQMSANEGMAEVYAVNGNVEKSIHYYKEAMKFAVQMRAKMLYSPHDSVVVYKENFFNEALLRYSTKVAALYCRLDGGEYMALAQLDSTYNKYNDSIPLLADYPLLAKISLQLGKVDEAGEYLSKYEKFGKEDFDGLSPDNLLELYSIWAAVAERRGDFKKASECRGKYILLKDSIDSAVRAESVREAEQQFWQRRLEEENYNIKVRWYGTVALYVIAFLLMSGIIAYIIVSYRKKMGRKNQLLAQYAAAMDSLGSRVSSAESARVSLLSQLDVHKAKEKELKDLLENRFAEVKELVRTYYESSGNTKKLQKKVDDLLKLQLSGDNFEVMEQVVNAKNNDVIKRVRERFPSMKEDNLKLLNLIYAGFSAQEISVILNDTPQNIYVRKSRLKKTLQEFILEDSQFNFS